MTTLLRVDLTAGSTEEQVSLRSVVKIRVDATDQVGSSEGGYALDGEWNGKEVDD
jgi:hypothetical protein